MTRKLLRVDQFADVHSGGTPSTANPSYWDGEIPWITPKDLARYETRCIASGERDITEEGLHSSSAKVLPADTVLLSTRAPVGYVAIALAPLATNQGFKNLVCRPGVAVPAFVYYMLKNSTELLESHATGATFKELSGSRLKAIEFELPDTDSQARIADILSAHDDLIENNSRRMTLLEEAARLLYREWFVLFRFPGHERAPLRNGLPDGWRTTFIGHFMDRGLVNLQTGPFGTQLKAADYTEAGTPVINVRNIGYGELRPDKLEYAPDHVVERLSAHVLRTGDIVFGRKGAVDRHLLISSAQDGWMQGSDCIRLRALSDDVCPILVSFAFREETHRAWMLTQCGNKATMASLNQEVISRIAVTIPTKGLLREFQAVAADALRQIDILSRQNVKLRAARDLLLPRLMTGEISV